MSTTKRDAELDRLYTWAANLQEELDSLKDAILELAEADG